MDDLQRAGTWKRISAWLLDIILLATLVVGAWWGFHTLFDYDTHANTYAEAVERYAKEYGLNPEMTQAEYDAMTEEERKAYDAKVLEVNALMNADEPVVHAYNMMVHLSLLSISLSVLAAMLLLEFLVPLLFGNGQTLGKKVFSIAVVRIDSVRITPLQLFVRTILGKFTIETMLPVYLIIMMIFGGIGTFGMLLLIGIMLAQVLVPMLHRKTRCMHDLLAGTVAVDMASQRIFRTPQDLVDYKTKLHAEEVARKGY